MERLMKIRNMLYLAPLTIVLSCASSTPGTTGSPTAADSLTVSTQRGLPQEGPPILLSMQPPVYPEMAREAGIEGTVIVRVLVGTNGLVKDMMVLQSVLGLDEAAVDAAWTARFKPAQENGQLAEVWMVLPIEFELP
jgi:protein TonB